MGYSTTLYAVDLDALKAAVGSGDTRLIRRLLPASKASKKDPNRGPRVKLTRKGEIILNGQPVTFNELKAELNRPKWKGTYLSTYIEATPRTGRWRKPGSFFLALTKSHPVGHFLGEVVCTSDEDLADSGEEDEELSEDEAAAELVEGKLTRPKEGYQYGYGLERLCELLGTHLTTIEGKGGMLKALELNTPLSKERSPVRLPKSRNDFPGVGYLTADEVRREVDRLGALDLSFPDDDLIEDDRKDLVRALRKAANKRVGVVAFYY